NNMFLVVALDGGREADAVAVMKAAKERGIKIILWLAGDVERLKRLFEKAKELGTDIAGIILDGAPLEKLRPVIKLAAEFGAALFLANMPDAATAEEAIKIAKEEGLEVYLLADLDNLDTVLALAKKYGAKVIAKVDKVEDLKKIVEKVKAHGTDILAGILISPLKPEMVDTLKKAIDELPGVKTVFLSGVSANPALAVEVTKFLLEKGIAVGVLERVPPEEVVALLDAGALEHHHHHH
uniref:De novo design protein n=1 Tax=synthetic construct TaxID=32630 RepID=UPI0034C6DF17